MDKKNRILVSYKVDEDLVNMFRSTTAFNGEVMSDVIERAIKGYVNYHRNSIDEKMKAFFDTKNAINNIK